VICLSERRECSNGLALRVDRLAPAFLVLTPVGDEGVESYSVGFEGRAPPITNALPDGFASWNRGLPDMCLINASRTVSLFSV
jgi:hypothetical protein